MPPISEYKESISSIILHSPSPGPGVSVIKTFFPNKYPTLFSNFIVIPIPWKFFPALNFYYPIKAFDKVDFPTPEEPTMTMFIVSSVIILTKL